MRDSDFLEGAEGGKIGLTEVMLSGETPGWHGSLNLRGGLAKLGFGERRGTGNQVYISTCPSPGPEQASGGPHEPGRGGEGQRGISPHIWEKQSSKRATPKVITLVNGRIRIRMQV